MRRAWRVGVLAAGLAFAGCEPSGPGDLSGAVDAPSPTGAVVLEVTGRGITGFAGTGDVRALSDPVDPRAASHRLVLVSASGGRMRFTIEVEDVGDAMPTARVVSAVDPSNAPIQALGGYAVRIAR